MIECDTVDGGKKSVNKKELIFRPSVYGVVIHGDQILFVKMHGKYYLPGGGMEVDETTPQAVVHKIKKETGLDIVVEKFLHFNESFFYHGILESPVHKLCFYYQCKSKSTDLTDANKIIKSHPEIEEVTWIKIDEIKDINYGGSFPNLFEFLRS